MLLALVVLGRVLAVADGALPAGEVVPVPAALLVGVLGVATVVALAGVTRVVLTLLGLTASVPAPAFLEPAGVRVLVWQRDPDARGHVRSRAPGAVATTA